MNKSELDEIGREIIRSAYIVHKEMGPALLESIYQHCLCEELRSRGIKADPEISIPLFYKGTFLDKSYRIDILAEDEVIIEVKAVELLTPLHLAQILSYLKLTGKWLGYLLNFHVPVMKDGIRRVVNGTPG